MRNPQANGTGNANPIDPEIVSGPGTGTNNGNGTPIVTGQAVPIPRFMHQPGQLVVSQKVVFGIGGFVLGAGVMYWLLRSMKEKR